MTPRMAGRSFALVLLLAPFAALADDKGKDNFPFLEATVAQLQTEMAAGHVHHIGGLHALRDRQERQVVLTRAGGKTSAPTGSAPRLLQLAGIPQLLFPERHEAVALFLAGGIPTP